jgi:hypothetical protein
MLGRLKAALYQATKLGSITFPSLSPVPRPVLMNPIPMGLTRGEFVHNAEHHGVPVGFGLRFLEVAQ